jgi:hypothetical protein
MFVLSCVGRGLCDGLITRPGVYRVSNCVRLRNVNTKDDKAQRGLYSERKINERLGNVTVRRGKDGKSKMDARMSTVCLSMYSITENIYYSQLSSVAILLQPEPVSHRIIQGNDFLSLCAIAFRSPPASNDQ